MELLGLGLNFGLIFNRKVRRLKGVAPKGRALKGVKGGKIRTIFLWDFKVNGARWLGKFG